MTDVTIDFRGLKLTHRGPAPWKAEKFKTGAACVTNANGINWISGLKGATLFDWDTADQIAAAFNEV